MKRKIIYYLSIMILLVSLVGCGMENAPKKKVEKLLSSYQHNSESIISELNDYLKTLASDDASFESNKRIYLRQYQDLTYEIKDETIDGDNATVTAQIEVYDSNKGLIYRIDRLNKSKDRVTYTITINLTKVNNDWTIDNLTNEDLEKIHGTYAH